VNVANAAGATTMLVNLEEPMNADDFDEIHLGKAGEILPAILEGLN
jgi:NAD-dependent SIR2 family protein deacetylase